MRISQYLFSQKLRRILSAIPRRYVASHLAHEVDRDSRTGDEIASSPARESRSTSRAKSDADGEHGTDRLREWQRESIKC